ncbi:MAG: hypothetical protein ACLVAP_14305 [Parasutterella sp.]
MRSAKKGSNWRFRNEKMHIRNGGLKPPEIIHTVVTLLTPLNRSRCDETGLAT